jgi:tetraacyldisaccharide 4'-kinase
VECLVRFWYCRSPIAYLAAPIALVFYALYYMRRGLYRLGLLRTTRLPVPVVVVGNIAVGGTGKTPLTLWLVQALMGVGLHPGIVCLSYRARATGPGAVDASGDPGLYGDEAVLLARLQSCPVWSGPDRVATARALTAAHPRLDVIVCDDGLQHYALHRDCEIAVIDAMRGFGNGMLLPAGPLREPPSRLKSVNAVVINGRDTVPGDWRPTESFVMRLEGETFHNLLAPERSARADAFVAKRVAAIAGIGNPQRFFEHLRGLGIEFTAYPFADHHPFSAGDLRTLDADVVLMTEKDAIKCAPFADQRMWVLPVQAKIGDALLSIVLVRIGKQDADARAFRNQA